MAGGKIFRFKSAKKPVHVVVDKPKRKTRKGKVSPFSGNYGIPAKKRVKMTFTDTRNLTSTSGVFTKYTYRGNGAYDPDQTGVGLQPYGFDQMMALYANFRVHGAKCKVQFWNNGSETELAQVGVEVSKSVVIPTTSSNVLRSKNKGRYIGLLGLNTNSAPVTIRSGGITKNIWQFKDLADELEFQGSISGDPTKQWFIQPWIQTISGSGSRSVFYVIQIDYDIEFFNPLMVDGS